MTIADKLKYYRQQNNLTQAQMAERLGLGTHQAYSNYEKLGDKFTIDRVRELSGLLNYDLLGDSGISSKQLSTAGVSVDMLAGLILKQHAMIELLFEDKIEEVATQTKRSVSIVSSEYNRVLQSKLRVLESLLVPVSQG